MAAFSMFGQAPGAFDWTQYQRGPAPAPATGLTFEDLYRPASRPVYPEPPQPYGGFGELGEDARKALRREAILRAAMALGGDPGRIGTNLAGAALSVGDWKDQQLEEARQRQQQDYALASRQAEFEADRERFDREDERNKTLAQGRLKAVQAVIEAEPEWGARAEAAALSGDDEALRKMLSDAETRRQIRSTGGDPDDPLWDDRRKSEMEEEQRRKHEEWLAEKGYGRYYDEPVDLAEIEAKARAAARGQHSVWGDRGGGSGDDGPLPRLLEHGDVPFQYSYDPATGSFTGRPVPGAPPPKESWTLVKDPDTGAQYYVSPNGGTRPIPPPPKPLSEVIDYVTQNLGRPLTAKERKEVETEWTKGTKPGLIVHRMKGPKPPGKGAPSQGQVRRPAPPRSNAGLPPPLRRKAASEQDKAVLRDKVKQRWPNLTPAEQEEKYQAALRLLEQGG